MYPLLKKLPKRTEIIAANKNTHQRACKIHKQTVDSDKQKYNNNSEYGLDFRYTNAAFHTHCLKKFKQCMIVIKTMHTHEEGKKICVFIT